MRFLILTLLVALMGCSNLPPPQRTDANPVVHDGNAEKGIEKAIVVIPGALASVQLFAPVLEWDIPDSTVIA